MASISSTSANLPHSKSHPDGRSGVESSGTGQLAIFFQVPGSPVSDHATAFAGRFMSV